MAGRKDHGELRIGCEQARPGFKQRGFFAFERAAGDDEAQTGGQRSSADVWLRPPRRRAHRI